MNHSVQFESARNIAHKWWFIKHNYVSGRQNFLTYIRYRILRPILKLYNMILISRLPAPRPWLAPAAIAILDKILTKSMKVMEYGSGSSTLFLAARANEVNSVEHDQNWYQRVKEQLQEPNLDHVKLHFIPPIKPETNQDVANRYKQLYNNPNHNYENYINFIYNFPDSYFDVVLVDGRARTECALAAMPKLKSGGILILDNSERPRYQPVHHALQSWPRVETTTGLTNTTFWFKP